MIVDVVRIAEVLNIRRTRRLPFPGQVLVSAGDDVLPGDPIAAVFLPGNIVALDLARGLGVVRDDALSCLVRDIGEDLLEGDVIARCDGTLSRLVRAPVDGTLIGCSHGKAYLAAGHSTIEIKAGMVGIVEEVIPEYGAVISTRGTLLQGVWGNGRVGAGILDLVAPSWEMPLDPTMLEKFTSNQVIAIGECRDMTIIDSLRRMALAGLIICVIEPALAPILDTLPMPVIVAQGFGSFAADVDIKNLLASRVGAMASVNGCSADIFSGHRPEVIIPRSDGEPEKELGFRGELFVGQIVRLLSGENMGQSGHIISLATTPVLMDNGLAFYTATIQLNDGATINVPQQNLVILRH